jgi:hypothetical protein
MEIQQASFKNFGSRHAIRLLEDKVLYQYWNPWYECSDEYAYSALQPRIITEKTGDDMWIEAGWCFLSSFFFYALFMFLFCATVRPHGLGREAEEVFARVATGIPLLLVSTAIAAFILRLVRYEYFIFVTKTDMLAFRIKYSSRNKAEAEKIADCILDNIRNAG